MFPSRKPTESAMIIKKITQLRILRSIVDDIELHPSCTVEISVSTHSVIGNYVLYRIYFQVKGIRVCYIDMSDDHTEISLDTLVRNSCLDDECHNYTWTNTKLTIKLADPEISQKCEEFINDCINVAEKHLTDRSPLQLWSWK